jgi:hypothetical protein
MSTTTNNQSNNNNTMNNNNNVNDDDDGDAVPANASASEMASLVQRAVDKAISRSHKALEVVRTARSLDDLSVLRPLVQVCSFFFFFFFFFFLTIFFFFQRPLLTFKNHCRTHERPNLRQLLFPWQPMYLLALVRI